MIDITNGAKLLLLQVLRGHGWADKLDLIYKGGKLVSRIDFTEPTQETVTWLKKKAAPFDMSDTEITMSKKAFKHFVEGNSATQTPAGSIGVTEYAPELMDALGFEVL